ncbi:MAG: hypothetical protein EHV01_004075 [Spiroplasma sp. hy2]|uniref:hypothetical protein n=1 Tax=Spiroplasma sp. hy2 TaxID=2490850 RepID=UPI003B4A1026
MKSHLVMLIIDIILLYGVNKKKMIDIVLYLYIILDKPRTIDKKLAITKTEGFLDLLAGGRGGGLERIWSRDNGTYFKAVYRWNNDSEPNKPFIDPKTGEITNWNLKNESNSNTNNKKTKIFQKTIFIN